MAVANPMAFWPLVITTGTNDKIDFKVGAGAQETAAIAAGTYYDIDMLCAAVQSALNATHNITWTCNPAATTGIITIAGASSFTILFSTGTNAAISMRNILGFGAVDTTPGTTCSGTLQHQNGWYADRGPLTQSPLTPVWKDRGQTISISGRGKLVTYGKTYVKKVSLGMLKPWKTTIADEALQANSTNQAIERLVESGAGRFRWWPDQTVRGTNADYFLDLSNVKEMPWNRYSYGLARYAMPNLLFRQLV